MRTLRHEPPPEDLKHVLSYNPDTGLLRWLITSGNARKGEIAGHANTNGYLQIQYRGRCYLAHRLIWWFMTWRWPKETVDHLNRDNQDNRWANLRQASLSQQRGNTKVDYRSVSGVKGVTWDKELSKWRVVLRGKHYGRFDDLEEAAKLAHRLSLEYYGDFYKDMAPT